MKKISLILSVFLIGSVVFFSNSCTKDSDGIIFSESNSDTQELSLEKEGIIRNNKTLDISNSNNNYDIYGDYHNQIVDIVVATSYPSSPDSLVEDSIKTKSNIEFLVILPNESHIDLDELNEISGFEGNYSDIDYEEDYGLVLAASWSK